MIKPLLIEIGLEELPAIPFLKELPNIEKKYSEILEKYSLLSKYEFYYTPRRLTFYHKEFLVCQEDTVEELFGAPVAMAYKNDKPTPALIGFAKKCGVTVDKIQHIEKNGKEVLYFKKETKGKNSEELLNSIINEFISTLKFGKSMRWGGRSDTFIRPIRSLSVVLGDVVVDANLYGVKSFNTTFVHRTLSYEAIEFVDIRSYFKVLEDNGVILYQDKREKKILNEFKDIESKHNIKIDIDKSLLAEIVAITEYPTALIADFDSNFLTLPKEVVITSMKEHQRYFAVFSEDKLVNKFVVISNAITDDYNLIIKGNQKVLKARLSDGLFFWNNDIKNGLSNNGLENVMFTKGLGSIADKISRELKIASYLYDMYSSQISGTKEELLKAVELSKSDLMSDMVYEFTELQGLMGYYYALKQNESLNIANAIKEQYLPNSEDGDMPSSLFSSIVALSHKLDNLLGLFSIGMTPTGSRDPFALRRATIGVIKLVIENRINFDISLVLNDLKSNYNSFDVSLIEKFFIERFNKFFNANSSIINAVVQSKERDILKISQKINALDNISNSSDWKEIVTTFKRVANIIKDNNINSKLEVDEKLFIQNEEKELFISYKNIVSQEYNSYEEELDALLSIKPQLDSFFDNVMVFDKDENIKENRKLLILNIYKTFLNVADISFVTT